VIVKSATTLFAAWALAGCDTLAYYAQAVNGHAQLLHAVRDIRVVVEEADTPDELRRRLQRVLAIRDFASRELALPDNGSYRGFAQLQRKAVVWSLVAAPEFSVEPVQWCYPVIGCAAYRGYFEREDARQAGRQLGRQGYDWAVEAVAAYSTLGWFSDPLPSTLLHWPEARLAGLIFHELAHQQLYLPGDSAFNESFASAVESAGVRRWLARQGDGEALVAYRREEGRYRAFIDLLLATRERLETLFSETSAVDELRRRKAAELTALRQRYRRLADGWGEGRQFDAWFDRPVNNARLALVSTYERWRPAFLELLHRHGEDFAAFYRAAEALSKLPAGQRRSRLGELAAAAAATQDCRRNCP
jgi:predicted aminopeptidase